jgi:hypothetical protein
MADDYQETAEDILSALGVDPSEAVKIYSEGKRERVERHICTCGHAKGRHYLDGETVHCKPNALECACSEFHPMLEVHDTRLFLHKTDGPGKEHALIRGLAATAKKQKYVKWIAESRKCRKCGTDEELTIYPIAGHHTAGFKITKEIYLARWNFLLCQTCAKEFQP